MLARAYFCLILSCILWSLNPVANKYALLELAVPQLVFMRTLCTAIVMVAISLFLGYSFRIKQIGWKPIFLGIIDPGLTSLFFLSSLTMVSASNSVLIMALMPFSQPILAHFVLKEKIQFSIYFGAIIALFGVAIFFQPLICTHIYIRICIYIFLCIRVHSHIHIYIYKELYTTYTSSIGMRT